MVHVQSAASRRRKEISMMRCSACLTAILLAGLAVGCGKREEAQEPAKEGAAEKPSGGESRIQHGTNGEVTVTVETNLQQTIGLQVSALEPAEISPNLKAYGRVLDPSSLAGLAGDLATAEAAQQSSEAELRRLKTLMAQNNTSERAVQTAEAMAVHDRVQAQSVRLRLLAAWGSAISQRKDLPEFVQTLGSLQSALVELDLPAGETPSEMPTQARLLTLGDETNPVAGQLLGPAPMVDPQMQSRGFLVLVSPNIPGLVPGAAVTGYLSLPGKPRSGVLLPRSAVVRLGGATWIYLQSSDQTFERQSVVLETPLEKGWFVSGGLKPGDKVVSVGAQQLLSEELKGQGGEE